VEAAGSIAAAVTGAPPSADFLAALARASATGGRTPWPAALFVPGALHGSSERSLPLPDGSQGTVRVELDSSPAEGLATMGRAARSVVTEVAGTRRVAREEWTLAAADTARSP